MAHSSTFSKRFHSILIMLFMMMAFSSSVYAAADLNVSKRLGWNVIGLDSNKPVTSGPNTYAIGYRFCNEGPDIALDVNASLVWDSNNIYINEQNSSKTIINIGNLEADACFDAYYNIEITRDTLAYDTSRSYHINVEASNTSDVNSTLGEELYVEKFVSQNRNSIIGIEGPTTVVQGGTYSYTLYGKTAPGGYEQLDTFIDFPNNIFRIVSVSSTYTQPDGAINDAIYADACGWENDPINSDYMSCVGPENYDGGKVGDLIAITYEVQILGTGSASVSALIYDFSGSSFHYNSDYGEKTIEITSIHPDDLGILIEKSTSEPFLSYEAGQRATFELNATSYLKNLSEVDINDTLPSGWSYVAGTAYIDGVLTSPTLSNNNQTLTWNTGTMDANSSRIITYDAITDINFTGGEVTVNITEVKAIDDNISVTDPYYASAFANTLFIAMDLNKTSSANGAAVSPGENITYTIGITNPSPVGTDAFLRDINISDPLPIGTTYVGGTSKITYPYTISSGNFSDNFQGSTGSGNSITEKWDDTNGSLDWSSDAWDISFGAPSIEETSGNYYAVIDNSDAISRKIPFTVNSAYAKLSFNYMRISGNNKSWTLRIYNDNNASWTTLDTYERILDNDSSYIYASYNISSYISSNTIIEFACKSGGNQNDNFYIDDINIDVVDRGIKSDQTAGDPSDLLDPDVLNVSLFPGESLTVDFNVTVDANVADLGIVDINNTVSVTTQKLEKPFTASTTDPVLQLVSADLNITKTVDNETPTVGDNVTFTLTVGNSGPDDASDVNVTDKLPTGYVYMSDNGAGDYNNTTGIWAIGDMLNGATETLTIMATVLATGNYLNEANVTSSTPDPDPSDNNDSVSTTPAAAAPTMTIVKTADDNTSVVAGQTITYTYDVNNTGNVVITDVNVTDVHSGTGTLSAISPASVASIAPGTGVSFTATYVVTQADINAGTAITNTATANGTPAGGTLTPPTDDESVSPAGAINIDAVDDSNNSVDGDAGGTAIPDVTDNDTLDGTLVTLGSDVNITAVTDTTPYLDVNLTTGAATVPAGTPAGTYTETYTICEIANPSNCDDANITVTVFVAPPVGNLPPVAEDDSQTTPKDTSVSVPVLNNDHDPEDDNLTIIKVGTSIDGATFVTGNGGMVSWDENGTVIYTPAAGYVGIDTFEYTITDGNGGEDSATVTIIITDPDDENSNSVTAVADSANTAFDTEVDIAVLTNDYDAQSDTFTLTDFNDTTANGGTVVRSGDILTYYPLAGFVGDDTFEYEITDEKGATDIAIVTVTVSADGADGVPNANADNGETNEATPITLNVMDNDTHTTDDTFTVTAATSAANGTVVIEADGSITYTPNPGFGGYDTFMYTITDSNGDTATASVTVRVKRLILTLNAFCENDVPYVNYDIQLQGLSPEGQTATMTWTSVDGGQTEIESNLALNNTHHLWAGAEVDSNDDGTVWPGWNELADGTWEIIYSDWRRWNLDQSDATVTVTLSVNPESNITVQYPPATSVCSANPPQNNLPPGTGGPVATDNLNIPIVQYGPTVIDVLANGDVWGSNGPGTQPIIFTQPIHGTVALDDGGTPNDPTDDVLIYIPAADLNNIVDKFTYTITDAAGNTSTATVTLNVNCASSQTSDGGDALGTFSIIIMMFLTLMSGLYFARKEEIIREERGEA